MQPRHFAAATLFAALATLPAAADQFTTLTYTSTALNSSFDDAGLFGLPGASLAGDPVTLVFTVDLNLGTPTRFTTYQTDLQTGYTYNLSSLNVAASITVNGQTFSSAPPTDTFGESIFQETLGPDGLPTQLVVGENSAYSTKCAGIIAYACAFNAYPPNESAGFQETAGQVFNGGSFYYNVFATNGYEVPLLSTRVDLPVSTPVVTYSTSPNPTPEPASLLLLGTGIVALAGAQRGRFSLKRN